MTQVATKTPSTETSSVIVFLMIASGIGLPSALTYALPVGQRIIGFLLLISTLMYFALSRRKVPLTWVILLALGVLLSVVTAIYWSSPPIVLVLGYIILGIFLVGMATIEEIRKSIEIASVVLLVVVVLAWVAVIYALGGGGPIWELGNPGQPLSLYLSTLALSVHGQHAGNLLRPAGIFDEPGALAFFISLCAACRMLLDMPKRTTWILLLAGVVTASLALLVFVIVVGMGEMLWRPRREKGLKGGLQKGAWVMGAVGSMVVLGFIIRYFAEISLVVGFLFDRLEFGGGGGRVIAGDSRSAQLIDTINTLNLRVFLFGSSESCFRDLQECAKLGLGGGNPLWPLLVRGAFAQFLYYLILLVMMVHAVLAPRRAFVYLAVVLMFFQRPYVLSLGYSTWAALVVMMRLKTRLATGGFQTPELASAPSGAVCGSTSPVPS